MKLLQELQAMLLDKVIASSLYEMAYSRDDAWKKCTGIVETLTKHLVKVLIMPTSTYVPHWKDEIKNYLDIAVDIRLKPKNKRLSTSTYREWLIEQPGLTERMIVRRVSSIKDQYPNELIEVPDTIFEDYRRIMEQICVDLGNDVVTKI